MASKIKVEQLEHPTSGQAVDFAVAPTVAGSVVNNGKVLQVVFHNPQVAQTSISTTSEVFIPSMDFTLNKVKANSRVICFITTYNYYTSSPTYWWMRASANGALVSGRGWNGSVLTHNASQYTYRTGAHQMYSGHFEDTTNAASITYTYSFQQIAVANLNIWGVSHPFIYMEIEND